VAVDVADTIVYILLGDEAVWQAVEEELGKLTDAFPAMRLQLNQQSMVVYAFRAEQRSPNLDVGGSCWEFKERRM
jgi:hypothetical protein